MMRSTSPSLPLDVRGGDHCRVLCRCITQPNGSTTTKCKYCNWTTKSKQTQATRWCEHFVQCKEAPIDERLTIWEGTNAESVKRKGRNAGLDKVSMDSQNVDRVNRSARR